MYSEIFLFILLIFGIYKGIQIHHDVKRHGTVLLVREVLVEVGHHGHENPILAMIYTASKAEKTMSQASERKW